MRMRTRAGGGGPGWEMRQVTGDPLGDVVGLQSHSQQGAGKSGVTAGLTVTPSLLSLCFRLPLLDGMHRHCGGQGGKR